MSFFKEVFGNCRGYLCIHVISGGSHSEEYFSYPEDVPIAQEFVRGFATKKGVNVYFYPVLFKDEDSSSAGAVACAPVVSADLNMVSPVLVTPIPDLIVETSRGRYQAYWYKEGGGKNETVVTPLSVNGIVDVGSGRELRRVPSTYNWKYHGDPWKIKLIDSAALDTCDKVRKRYDLYGESFDSLFRSGDRWSLARFSGRLGASTQEVFLVLLGAQLRHMGVSTNPTESIVADSTDDSVPIGTLYREAGNAVAASKVPSLLSDDELRSSSRIGRNGFVERYVSWASTCTDSPSQYHIAGALTILSSLLCPHLRLDTSFGAFRPNLWFLILAGTTITRKSTSMRLAVRLLEEVHNDPILATDGTPEGIISELSDRDGKSSLFLRDEITGFIEAMTRKDYLAGMLEVLTKLYDGEKEKRTLRRQTIEVKDPNLVILSGGIKNKMAEILDAKHIGSGFLPRFLVVSGWTGVEDMKAIGPPTETSSEFRDMLINELTVLYKQFSGRPAQGEVDGHNIFQAGGRAKINHVSATDDAWNRIRRLETDVREMGLSSESPDIFGPIYERMMNSIIKVAILIAADRIVREGKSAVELSLDDIVIAISYSDVWIESVYELARNIDDKPTEDELKVESIEKFIVTSSNPSGVTRSELMRRFRMRASNMNDIEATLIQRGTVAVTKLDGKKTIYRASTSEVESSR